MPDEVVTGGFKIFQQITPDCFQCRGEYELLLWFIGGRVLYPPSLC
jgi:hypothetical protein